MQTIDEILGEVRYSSWDRYEQLALTEMMNDYAQGKPFKQEPFCTGRVTATFIKILDTHIQDRAEQAVSA